ncbi:MAG TPA: PLP-dependent aminotransferase family protein [Anaerolineae bacterium]|nr:PLP-dependent aminotransferase family protein [Anaerolineae bacterium]HOQ99141.1 PLP-dependent aminotransferase family protein [Anaerolineae bacterium]
MQWRMLMGQRAQQMSSSIIREILKFAQQPDLISLAGGWPAAGLFPVEDLADACREVLSGASEAALQYGVTEGYAPLRRTLAEMARAKGLPVDEGNILVTSGSQQALDLVGRLFIDPDDVVLVERPTYLGALQAWQAYGARFVSVPVDDDGMDVAAAEAVIAKHHPKFVYVMPNFHNPAGVTLSLARRRQLLELVRRYGIALVEDDPYGDLRFEGEDVAPLYALDAASLAAGDPGSVIYMSTFSKTLAPGLRLGWIIAPAEVAQRLAKAKQGADLHTASLCQVLANEYCQRGLLGPHIEEIRATYRERRDALLAALARHMPPGVRWTQPQGGLFLWLSLPEQVDSLKLLEDAIAAKVAFVPGTAFYADDGGRNAMRLTFASTPPALIDEGIRRLALVLKKHMEAVNA